MDHPGDMARYINEGLQALGYPGAGELWNEERGWIDEYRINDDGSVTLEWVWGKDAAFEITIRQK